MGRINKLNKLLNKLLITLRDFKKTAYHHYGKSPLSLFKFLYYSVLRINTFFVVENDLTRELPELDLDPDYRVMKPSLDELAAIRSGREDLPREFYYDKIYSTTTCYVVFKGEELAYIHWVLLKGDYNRFLILGDGVAELNYNTTLPKFRGNKLMAKMIAYISKDLKESGYRKALGVIHEDNYQSIRAAENAGFRKIASIKALGPFNRKVKV
jgi:hypothetical protein